MGASGTDLHLLLSLVSSNFSTTLYSASLEEQSTDLRSGLNCVPSLCMQLPTDVVSASDLFHCHLTTPMTTAIAITATTRSSFLLKRPPAGGGGGTGAPGGGNPG